MFVWIAVSPSTYNSGNIFFWVMLSYRLLSHQYYVKQTHFRSFHFYCAIRDKRDIQHITLGLDSQLQTSKTNKEKYSALQEQQQTSLFPGQKEQHGNSPTFFTSMDSRIITCIFGHTSYKSSTHSDRKQSS